jgi:hypothetical protein
MQSLVQPPLCLFRPFLLPLADKWKSLRAWKSERVSSFGKANSAAMCSRVWERGEHEERRLAGEAIFAVILLAHVHLNVHARLG